MADRRMFTVKIVDSDAFLDMPLSAQCLYFHLNMRADDDGFVNNPKKIQRMLGASDDDLRLLLAKRFILGFESGVIVIKHWRMHNLLRKDRYNPTQYQEEFHRLGLKENGAYTETDNHLATTWQPDGNQMATQDRIDKESIGKISNKTTKAFTPPSLEDVKAYCQSRHNGVNPQRFFDYYQASDWHDASGKPVKNWKQKVITWEKFTPEQESGIDPMILRQIREEAENGLS